LKAKVVPSVPETEHASFVVLGSTLNTTGSPEAPPVAPKVSCPPTVSLASEEVNVTGWDSGTTARLITPPLANGLKLVFVPTWVVPDSQAVAGEGVLGSDSPDVVRLGANTHRSEGAVAGDGTEN
jgi:hypothetical protein